MKKVKAIKNTDRKKDSVRCLYEAASQVFELPTWNEIVEFATTGTLPEFPDKSGTPHRGYMAARLETADGLEGILVETDGGRRIWLRNYREPFGYPMPSGFSQIEIEFLPPSLAAAGMIIWHIWESRYGSLNDGFFQVELSDGSTVDGDNYDGPVHPELGRARFDEGWRAEHPELAAVVPAL